MTTNIKRKPLPADPAAEAREAERQFNLSQNETLKRNQAQAVLDRNNNMERALADAIAALRLAMPGRDASPNTRQRYEMAYGNMRRELRQLVLATGKSYHVPKYFPAPVVPDDCEVVGPEQFPSSGMYHEGGSRPTGIQPTRPDGSVNESWLNLQGAK